MQKESRCNSGGTNNDRRARREGVENGKNRHPLRRWCGRLAVVFCICTIAAFSNVQK